MRLLLLALGCTVMSVRLSAQHVEIGVASALAHPLGAAHRVDAHLVPVLGLAPSRGWGVAAALNWFRTTHETDSLTVRPIMAGVGYTFPAARVLVTPSLVAGPAWTTVERGADSGHAVTLAVRAGLSASVPLVARISGTASAGYLWNGRTIWRPAGGLAPPPLDAVVASVGLVLRVF